MQRASGVWLAQKSTQVGMREVACTVGALILMATSSMLLHESGSWALDVGMLFGVPVNARALSCNAHAIGLVCGYAITQLAFQRFCFWVREPAFWIVFYLVQVVNVLVFYQVLGNPDATLYLVVSQFVGALSGAVFLVFASQMAHYCSVRQCAVAIMAVLAGTTVLVQGLFSTLEASAPLVISEVLHVLVVVASAGLLAVALFVLPGLQQTYGQVFEEARPREKGALRRVLFSRAPYVLLFVTIGVYSAVFGFLHVVPLALPLGVFSRVITFLLGSVIALVLFSVTMGFDGEIGVARLWNRFYRLVFPLVTVAALLGPLTVQSEFIPALVLQAGALFYFDALLALGAYVVAKAVGMVPAQAFARVFLIRAIGFLAGNLIGMTVHDLLELDAVVFSVIGTTVFVLLVAVTFNVNAEKYAKTVWGLLPHEDPRGMFARRLNERCERLSQEGSLTEREAEVLALLARGKRPKDISEDLVVSLATVRSHVQAIYTKAGVHSHDDLMKLLDEH